MADPEYLELIHAEIDGEIDARQAADLDRHMQADPTAAAVRDDLRRLCAALDSEELVAPPADLAAGIMAALPVGGVNSKTSTTAGAGPALAAVWRYAAMLAGVLITGAILYTGIGGRKFAASELAGTLTGANGITTLETVTMPDGPLIGRVSLTRGPAGLGLSFDLSGTSPVDVVVASGGHGARIDGLNLKPGADARPIAVAMPAGIGADGQEVRLTFLADGERIAVATLAARSER